jgi:hypothetical protein
LVARQRQSAGRFPRVRPDKVGHAYGSCNLGLYNMETWPPEPGLGELLGR